MKHSESHSIVVPLYNEEAVIDAFHKRLTTALEGLENVEIVYVDDGSNDSTPEKVARIQQSDPRVKCISLARNFGHQAALSAGLDVASGTTVTMLDGDLQHPPELIPELIAEWRKGADIVFAVKKARRGESWFKRWSAHVFYRLIRSLAHLDIPPDVADFRLIDARVAQALRGMREGNRYLRGLVGWLGMRRAYVEFTSDERQAGESKYAFRHMFGLAADAVFSFSVLPLRIAAATGAVIAVAGLVYAVYAIYVKFALGRAVEGWTSLLVVVLLFGGIQLLTLGLLGEYVGRIHDEVRRRPLYVVQETSGFDQDIETHYASSPLPYAARWRDS